MLIFTNHSGKIPRPALQRCQAGRGFFITLFIWPKGQIAG